MKKIKELYLKYREIIDYLFWGVMTTAVSFVSYAVFALLFEGIFKESALPFFGKSLSITVTVSNIFSWICAVLFAFITNKLFVFRSKSWRTKVVLPEFAKFLSARIATGVLEMVIVPLLVAVGLSASVFGVEGMVAKVIVSIAVIILNYIFSKLFIFKK